MPRTTSGTTSRPTPMSGVPALGLLDVVAADKV
jgi:hypothetical protein